MTDNTTHDLALARAERDAWQSTCEELHRTIAGRDVEIEAHLGRIEAAGVLVGELDAALKQWRAVGDRLATIAGELFGPFPVQSPDEDLTAIERGAYDGIRAAQELAAIRDLVAPGSPQGTVVDAVRAMIDMDRRYRDTADEDARAAIDRADKAESELAELRARPVLTVEALTEAIGATTSIGTGTRGRAIAGDILAVLGPVTLPSPDLAHALVDKMQSYGWWYASDSGDGRCASDMKRAITALAKLSPAPAREVEPTRVLVHSDGGACHGSRVVDGRCVGCGLAPDIQSTSLWLDADARPRTCATAAKGG